MHFDGTLIAYGVAAIKAAFALGTPLVVSPYRKAGRRYALPLGRIACGCFESLDAAVRTVPTRPLQRRAVVDQANERRPASWERRREPWERKHGCGNQDQARPHVQRRGPLHVHTIL